MSDYGMLISSENYDIEDENNIIFTTKYPTAKLDTFNPISFQNIVFRFNNDPPEPIGPATSQRTKVYVKAHGYPYIPSFWSLINETTPPVGTHFYQRYFQELGVISAMTAFDSASFYIEYDDTNINFWVDKFNDGGSPNPLTGTILTIRLYVFVEDLGT